MKKQLNKRTKKHQRGGAASAARASRPSNGAGYTQADVDEFCTNLYQYKGRTSSAHPIIYDSKYGKPFNNATQFDPKFFEYIDEKQHNIKVKDEWKNMIQNGKNSEGKTILYVALEVKQSDFLQDAFKKLDEVIKSIIEMNTRETINRPNTDGSLPLHAVCSGKIIGSSRVNFDFIFNYIDKIIKKGGVNAITTTNNGGLTPIDVLAIKEAGNMINYE